MLRTDVQRYLLVLIPVTLAVVGQTLAKLGVRDVDVLTDAFNICVILAFVLMIGRAFVWVYIVRFVDISVAFPMMSSTYVFILTISHQVFGEEIGARRICGTAMIILGISLLTLGESRKCKEAQQ